MGKSKSERLKIAIYIRVANEETTKEDSVIEKQKFIINEYLKENLKNIEYKRYYIDNGYSGNNYLRPEYQKMLDDISNQKINTVIVKDLSRISRKMDNVKVVMKWQKSNINFIAIDNKIDTINNKAESYCILDFMNCFHEMEKEDSKKRYHNCRKRGKYKI